MIPAGGSYRDIILGPDADVDLPAFLGGLGHDIGHRVVAVVQVDRGLFAGRRDLAGQQVHRR